MIYKGISFEFLADMDLIPEPFRIIWSDFAIDARTIKAASLKLFAEEYELWGDVYANLGAHSDAVLQEGNQRNNKIAGSSDNDFVFGHEGDDKLVGKAGADFLIGGKGNDKIDLGGGFFNRGRGGDGNDMIKGGSGMDWVHGNNGDDMIRLKAGHDKGYGGDGNDRIMGGKGHDWLQGAEGNDTLVGGSGSDTLHGGADDDLLIDRRGRDWLDGGAGNDTLISRSDAGIPDMSVNDFDHDAATLENWNDRLTGGAGADEFHFIYEMNASKSVASGHLRADGSVNWMSVMTENANIHDHWVDWGGIDKIDDFNSAEGDHIFLSGHTVNITALTQIDLDGNGSLESTLITVFSDQAAQMAMMGMGGMPMAHDRDFLGAIIVENALIDVSDITIDASSMEARFDFI